MLHPLGYIEGHFKNSLASNEGAEAAHYTVMSFMKLTKRDLQRGYTIQLLKSPGPIESFHYLKKFKNKLW